MKKVDIDKVYRILRKHVINYRVPVADLVEIQTRDPFKVLVATILSARTNDKTTSIATRKLFSKVKKISDLERLSLKEIENLIYPAGFYRNKAKYLKELPLVLVEQFGNKIPDNVDDLVKIPGVGRKTANLVVAVGFRKPAICVDTHVHRIMNRLGYIRTKTPFETERILREKLPKKYWKTINTILVTFGQNICRPVSPYCSMCPTNKYCNKMGVNNNR
jgi:endonuclease III